MNEAWNHTVSILWRFSTGIIITCEKCGQQFHVRWKYLIICHLISFACSLIIGCILMLNDSSSITRMIISDLVFVLTSFILERVLVEKLKKSDQISALIMMDRYGK